MTRIREIDAGTAKQGKTPQMRHAPNGSAALYGDLNKVAHPSNESLLHRHLEQLVTHGIRGVSPVPVFLENTTLNTFSIHCWLCYSICHASVLVLLENYGEEDPTLWTVSTASYFFRIPALRRVYCAVSEKFLR